MTLPPKIEIRARCAEASDISGIIFQIQITAGKKNPYQIIFPKTGVDGNAVLTAEIRMQFEDHQYLALMDYDGSLEEAVDVVTLRLFDPEAIRNNYKQLSVWPLTTYERTKWQSRGEFLEYLLTCSNEQFVFSGLGFRLPGTVVLFAPQSLKQRQQNRI